MGMCFNGTWLCPFVKLSYSENITAQDTKIELIKTREENIVGLV